MMTDDAEPPVGRVEGMEAVFVTMFHRKLMRRLEGTYESDKPWVSAWVFLTLIVVFGLAVPSLSDETIDLEISFSNLGFVSLMAFVSLVFFIYTLTKVVVVVRWCLYWLLFIMSLTYFVTGSLNVFGSDTPDAFWIALVTVETLTLLAYAAVHYAYPYLVVRRYLSPRTSWSLDEIDPYTFTYAAGGGAGRKTGRYRGDVHGGGLADGAGR